MIFSTTNLNSKVINFDFLELLFNRKTDAITPRIIKNVFGEAPAFEKIPKVLTVDLLSKIKADNLCLISFLPKTSEEIIKLAELKHQRCFFSREKTHEDMPVIGK